MTSKEKLDEEEIEFKLDGKIRIGTTYLRSLTHLMILITQTYYLLKRCPLQSILNITSFNQLTYILTLTYYTSFLWFIINKPKLLQPLVIYINPIITGMIWLNYSLTPKLEQPDNLYLYNEELVLEHPFLRLGTFHTIYLPLILWYIFHITYHQLFTVLLWDYKNRTHFKKHLYTLYMLLSPLLVSISWFLLTQYKNKLILLHGKWYHYFILIVNYIIARVGYSFFSFQYCALVWEDWLKLGYLAIQNEGQIQFYKLY